MMVTCLNLPSLDGDRALLRRIRDVYPDVQIVASGTVCKNLPEEALGDGLVDLSPAAEDELVIRLAADSIAEGRRVTQVPGGLAWKDGDLILSGPPAPHLPLDELPFPAYDLMPMKSYTTSLLGRSVQYAPIYSSRGCPYPCSYCPYPVGLGDRVVYRSPSKVAEEIDIVHELGADGLIFRDQTFTLNRRHAAALCDEIAMRDLSMSWVCETRVDLVNQELLRKMIAAGCVGINYGMETGDPELLENVGKPGANMEDLARAVRLTRRAGLMVQVHLIVGLPGETWDTVHTTLESLFKLKVDSADFNIVTPYPGTKLYDYAQEHDLIVAKSWSDFSSHDPSMRTESMTAEELKQAQQYLSWAFRTQAPFATRWIRRWRLFLRRANKLQVLRRFAFQRAFDGWARPRRQ